MFRALKQQRKKTAMVRFPGENHELSRSGTPSRRLQRLSLYRRWFGRFLLGEEAPEFDEPFERGDAQAAKPAETPAAERPRRRPSRRVRQRPLASRGPRRRAGR